MEWSRDFTILVLRFATRFAELGEVSQDDALLKGTPLYPNFQLGTTFDAQEPLWREFLRGYHVACDPVEWTHSFYRAHARQPPPYPYGCFTYHYDPNTRTAGLHFGNRDTSGLGALSRDRRPERVRELTAMFVDLRRAHPNAETVRGGSWLYNLPAYQALFPLEYIATKTPVRPGLTYLDVWGQFLDGRWRLRSTPAQEFIANIERATSVAELERSFPLLPLILQAPIQHFYAFYHID